ncbi:MAG TPA: TetR/AcrR family transcriptional regulator [Rhodopila sp.]|uniref:TetR/AcrR family transcriptional regulator n=1 Tax=Rhodopila sp. TaxID=2480087 RepID=UPI002D055EB7|nr:TetR/AcrR family transcriptional regulator [Rhodopila sp.]HVY16401.1 TetR/AcrR family transcriptional regulator [Rhodopila sp.]
MSDTLSPEKRDQILQGASRVFAADGYEGASMARIAQEAGVSKGTLYNYFDGKAALFSTYVAEVCQRNLAHVFDRADHDGDPAAVLREIGRRMLTMVLSDAGLTMYRMVIAEAAKFPILARAFFEAGPARAIDFLSRWLEEETRRGRLAVDDPSFAAEQFFNLCQTHLVLRRKLEMLADPSEAEIERVVDAAVRVFLRSYGVKAFT